MKRIFVLLGMFFIITASDTAQTGIPKAQAMFIYNFSRLIEWPASYKTGTFVIGVIGTSEIISELELYTTGKKVGSQDILVKQYKDQSEVDKCHILFIPFSKTKILGELSGALQNKSTLIVSEKNGAIAEGSAINFAVIGDKLKFEVSSANASKYGIKLSAKLNEMAYKVY